MHLESIYENVWRGLLKDLTDWKYFCFYFNMFRFIMIQLDSFIIRNIFTGHGADVKCVDWHPCKSLLASGSKDNQQPIKLWDPRTGQPLAKL